MKILINAYACSPYQGSEPGMGWNFVSCLSHMHELHILTECKFQDDIERYLSLHPEERPYYHFYFVKRVRLNLLRKIWPPSYYWTYAAWQRKALALARELDKKENFDIIHQLNMVGFREPGYLWKIDKPFIWGPMGNFNITPMKILPIMGFYGACYYSIRNVMNWWQTRFSTRVRKAAERAGTIICATEDDRKAVKHFFHKDAITITEVGLTPVTHHPTPRSNLLALTKCSDSKNTQHPSPNTQRPTPNTQHPSPNIHHPTPNTQHPSPTTPLKVCWSGVHVPRKALPLLLHALQQCTNKEHIELHILGEGPCTGKWKRLARKLHITNITWYGQVSRDEALEVMRQCHVFTMTSLSDATSTVLLEALSLHIPVIALNHLGFAGVINDSCGIKINLDSIAQIEHDMASALDKLYEDEAYRQRLAEGAFLRAQDFSWAEKARTIDTIYKKQITR